MSQVGEWQEGAGAGKRVGDQMRPPRASHSEGRAADCNAHGETQRQCQGWAELHESQNPQGPQAGSSRFAQKARGAEHWQRKRSSNGDSGSRSKRSLMDR